MHSSPATPTGTSWPCGSMMRTRVLAMGWPTWTGSSALTRATVDHTVVSVGPNRFQTSSEQASSLPLSDADIASPPHSTFRPSSLRQPECRSSSQVDGVACMTVGRVRWIRARSAAPSRAVAPSLSTHRAPWTSGRKSSRTAISKLQVVTASRVSSAARPGLVAMDSRKLVSAPCGIITPLGLPVLPEV